VREIAQTQRRRPEDKIAVSGHGVDRAVIVAARVTLTGLSQGQDPAIDQPVVMTNTKPNTRRINQLGQATTSSVKV
jgi:hypothetical protein